MGHPVAVKSLARVRAEEILSRPSELSCSNCGKVIIVPFLFLWFVAPLNPERVDKSNESFLGI